MDGDQLHDIGEIPSGVHPAFVARIKILARMDIAEKRRPQDGRIKTQRGEREIELRVSAEGRHRGHCDWVASADLGGGDQTERKLDTSFRL